MRGIVRKKKEGEGDKEMKVGKAAGPLEVSVEMIVASEEIRVGVMVWSCVRV